MLQETDRQNFPSSSQYVAAILNNVESSILFPCLIVLLASLAVVNFFLINFFSSHSLHEETHSPSLHGPVQT